jgi:hypothetical protein
MPPIVCCPLVTFRKHRIESHALFSLDLTLNNLLIVYIHHNDNVLFLFSYKVAQKSQGGGSGNMQEYRHLKFEFEKNKLRRYMVERQLATLRYQQQLLDQVDASAMQFTNPPTNHQPTNGRLYYYYTSP